LQEYFIIRNADHPSSTVEELFEGFFIKKDNNFNIQRRDENGNLDFGR